MPRTSRVIVPDESAIYHVMSRTALDGFVLGDVEKDYLVSIIKRLSSIYFSEVLGFCIMGNHFHLVTRMQPGVIYTDEEIKKRFSLMYADNPKRELMTDQISYYREKWSNLSEYVKEIKQTFSRFYNKRHKRKGFFWADRFKSILVNEGDTLINLLAYVDLNPVRAGIIAKPEEYRWSSIGYHFKTGNKSKFLSTDFGLIEFSSLPESKKFKKYLEFVYLKGGLADNYELPEMNSDNLAPLLRKNRYFIDGGIIGSKDFVMKFYGQFKEYFSSKTERRPRGVAGFADLYSLKRLSDNFMKS
jgi:putative transposase